MRMVFDLYPNLESVVMIPFMESLLERCGGRTHLK